MELAIIPSPRGSRRRMRGARMASTSLTICLLIGACAPKHIEPFNPRQRKYEPGIYAQTNAKSSPGSIFSDATPGFLEDTRARRVGDVVVIVIDESAGAEGGANTALKRDSSFNLGTNAILGLIPAIQKLNPEIDPSKLLDWAHAADFSGDGTTKRKGQLQGRLALRVAQELPNGDLFLEGTKVILINNEETHLYISGVARPADIQEDNTLQSSRIADAQFEFTGRGDIADQNRRGWMHRLIDKVNPF